MQNNTTTVTATVATPAVKKPVQITCGIRKEEKDTVKLFCDELTRIGSQDKIVGASEKEIVEIALKIATDHRFFQELVSPEDIAQNSETGELEIVPAVYVWTDRFEVEWSMIKARDYSTPGVRTNRIVEEVKGKHSAAVTRLREMYAESGMSAEAIEAALVGLV